MTPAANRGRERPSLKTATRYALLQLPGILAFGLVLWFAHGWLDLGPAAAAWLLGLWVAKDILMFAVLWRFYDPDRIGDRWALTGRRGIAVTALAPKGHVRIRGERWRAVLSTGSPPAEPGTPVVVEAVDGLRLTVRPLEEGGRHRQAEDGGELFDRA